MTMTKTYRSTEGSAHILAWHCAVSTKSSLGLDTQLSLHKLLCKALSKSQPKVGLPHPSVRPGGHILQPIGTSSGSQVLRLKVLTRAGLLFPIDWGINFYCNDMSMIPIDIDHLLLCMGGCKIGASTFFHLWGNPISAPINNFIQKSLQQLSLGSREIVVKASGNPFDVGQATGRDGNEMLGQLQSLVRKISISEADRAAHYKDYHAVSSTLTDQRGEEMADKKLTDAPDFTALETWLQRKFWACRFLERLFLVSNWGNKH